MKKNMTAFLFLIFCFLGTSLVGSSFAEEKLFIAPETEKEFSEITSAQTSYPASDYLYYAAVYSQRAAASEDEDFIKAYQFYEAKAFYLFSQQETAKETIFEQISSQKPLLDVAKLYVEVANYSTDSLWRNKFWVFGYDIFHHIKENTPSILENEPDFVKMIAIFGGIERARSSQILPVEGSTKEDLMLAIPSETNKKKLMNLLDRLELSLFELDADNLMALVQVCGAAMSETGGSEPYMSVNYGFKTAKYMFFLNEMGYGLDPNSMAQIYFSALRSTDPFWKIRFAESCQIIIAQNPGLVKPEALEPIALFLASFKR